MKRPSPAILFSVAAITLIFGYAEFSQGQRNGRDGRDVRGPRLSFPLSALPQTATAPPDNEQTSAKIELGRMLFWDPILSGNREVACATCHHPSFGYAENLDLSIGVDGIGLGNTRHFDSSSSIPFVRRNSQTILNTAFNGIDPQGNYNPATAPMFWDVRAEGLEAQALLPIITFEEMRGHTYPEEEAIDHVVERLRDIDEYRELFEGAFSDTISAENLGKALAAFQRSLLANNSSFDRYMRGDENAMTRTQIQGMRQFERVGCMNCHNGPMFSDFKLHVLGIADNRKLPESDQGFEQSYAFRTPSLRNLAFTPPYMHNGIFRTLDDVLDFYDDRGRRGRRNQNLRRDQLDPLLRALDDVDDHEREIIEFLGALNDDSFDKSIPARVPSGLNPGGRI
jgi:cytochrome c peroxidase